MNKSTQRFEMGKAFRDEFNILNMQAIKIIAVTDYYKNRQTNSVTVRDTSD